MAAQASDKAAIERLMKSGAHFAQMKSRRHPSMKPYILGAKARMEIFDLAKTDEQLQAAKAALIVLGKEGKTVLYVGGKAEVQSAVKDAAHRAGAPYVAGRWLGGTITNFPEIKKRIDRLADLSAKRESGELAKIYTKLELVKIDREIVRLSERLAGIETLEKRPDALLVVDTRHEAHAVKEAKAWGIPVIAIQGSDCNVKDATYPIAANDASVEAVTYLLAELTSALNDGRKG